MPGLISRDNVMANESEPMNVELSSSPDLVEDDSLADEPLQSNPESQDLVAKSTAAPRKPFPPER
jgi:hypothetical protein